MNDYDTREQSTEDSTPFYAYWFQRGEDSWFLSTYGEAVYFASQNIFDGTGFEGEEYGFFNSENYPDSLFFGTTFREADIQLTAVKTVKEIASAEITLKLPRTDSFAQEFMNSFTKASMELTIFRGQADQYGYLRVAWRGRVVGSTVKKHHIDIVCENLQTQILRLGLRAKFQKLCRHVLYGDGCNVDINAYKVSGTITSYNELTLNIPVAAVKPDRYYQGGILFVNGNLGYIISHQGQEIKLNSPVEGLANGVSVELAPGCDLGIRTCQNKFNNLLNHGGFPFIPSKSAFGGTNVWFVGT